MSIHSPLPNKNCNYPPTTPSNKEPSTLRLLESLIGISPNDPDFLAKEKQLAAQGAEERRKYQEMYDRKAEKVRKAAVKGKRKKRVKEEESEAETESQAGTESDNRSY